MLTKVEARERAWRALEASGQVGFPGATGRIPNFTGAGRAADRLATLEVWRRARVLKCNPDYSQRPVRLRALRAGKVVYMAVPRLRGESPFIELDPERLGDDAAQATSIAGAERLGRRVRIEDVPAIDLVVAGTVAAGRDGVRVGKGGGYSDLEYAVLRQAGRLEEDTPIVTTVHPLQVFDAGELPREPHDITLDWIVTPEETLECRGRAKRPSGVDSSRLSLEQLEEMPAVAVLIAARR